jgi:hypothetical protein
MTTRGRTTEDVIDDQPGSQQRDLAGIVQPDPLHLQRSGDVSAGKHHLARAPAFNEAEVPVDLGE